MTRTNAPHAACGANSAMPMKPMPVKASPIASQLSAMMPVITVADASTIPIWNAADAIS